MSNSNQIIDVDTFDHIERSLDRVRAEFARDVEAVEIVKFISATARECRTEHLKTLKHALEINDGARLYACIQHPVTRATIFKTRDQIDAFVSEIGYRIVYLYPVKLFAESIKLYKDDDITIDLHAIERSGSSSCYCTVSFKPTPN